MRGLAGAHSLGAASPGIRCVKLLRRVFELAHGLAAEQIPRGPPIRRREGPLGAKSRPGRPAALLEGLAAAPWRVPRRLIAGPLLGSDAWGLGEATIFPIL